MSSHSPKIERARALLNGPLKNCRFEVRQILHELPPDSGMKDLLIQHLRSVIDRQRKPIKLPTYHPESESKPLPEVPAYELDHLTYVADLTENLIHRLSLRLRSELALQQTEAALKTRNELAEIYYRTILPDAEEHQRVLASPFILAAQCGLLHQVKCERPNDKTLRSEWDHALEGAAMNGHLLVVRYLLKQGAQASQSLIEKLRQLGHVDLVKLLETLAQSQLPNAPKGSPVPHSKTKADKSLRRTKSFDNLTRVEKKPLPPLNRSVTLNERSGVQEALRLQATLKQRSKAGTTAQKIEENSTYKQVQNPLPPQSASPETPPRSTDQKAQDRQTGVTDHSSERKSADGGAEQQITTQQKQGTPIPPKHKRQKEPNIEFPQTVKQWLKRQSVPWKRSGSARGEIKARFLLGYLENASSDNLYDCLTKAVKFDSQKTSSSFKALLQSDKTLANSTYSLADILNIHRHRWGSGLTKTAIKLLTQKELKLTAQERLLSFLIFTQRRLQQEQTEKPNPKTAKKASLLNQFTKVIRQMDKAASLQELLQLKVKSVSLDSLLKSHRRSGPHLRQARSYRDFKTVLMRS